MNIRTNKLKWILLFVPLLVSCVSNSGKKVSEKKEDSLKVLSWNIWHAGHTETYGQKACDGCVPSRKRLTTFLLIDSKGCLLFNIFVKQVVLFFIYL